jgi:hypothetical protein
MYHAIVCTIILDPKVPQRVTPWCAFTLITMATKLTSTLLGLKCFYIMVAIVVGLVWNVF